MGIAMGSMRSFVQDASVLKQKIRAGTARRVLRFAIPYTGILCLFLLLVILDATVGIATPLVYRDLINLGILKFNPGLVLRLAAWVGILGLFGAALGFGQAYLSAQTGARIVLSLRIRLFEHIQGMPLSFFTKARTGALVNRLNNDVNGAQTAFTDILSNVIGNAVTVVLVLSAMFVLSWQITLSAVILLPVFLFPARYWGRRLQQITRESYNLSAAMDSFVIERFYVAGAQLSKLFGRPEQEAAAFEAKARRVSDMGVKRSIYARLFLTGLMLTAVCATAFAYGWGGWLAVRHRLDVGAVIALVAYLARLYAPLAGLSNVQVSIMTALVSFERVFEVLDLPQAIREKPDAVPVPAGPVRLSLEHVFFRYPAPSEIYLGSLDAVSETENRSRTVLHDITFDVEPGQMVALVGPSGTGKTTVTHLIARLYDVQEGSVSVNGVDVRDLKLGALYERIGVVTQEPYLFNDTIQANLSYAKPNASDSELRQALRDAQLLPLILSLPQGLGTVVGERGFRLSGGEKQRLAIARLLLKAPDIVILDEATAHLDSESEASVQRAFEIALRGRTSVVIAHRLSTILKADRILVMQDGRIVDRGTHEALLERRGLYSELYRLQFASSV